MRRLSICFFLLLFGCAKDAVDFPPESPVSTKSMAVIKGKPDGPVVSRPIPSSPNQPPIARDIKPSVSMVAAPCRLHEPHKGGGRAFFGIEANMCFDQAGAIGVFVVGLYRFNKRIPISEAGITVGDRIAKIRGCGISNAVDLRRVIEGTGPGDSVYVQIESRQNVTKMLLVQTIAFYPENFSEDRVTTEPLCGKIGLRQAPILR